MGVRIVCGCRGGVGVDAEVGDVQDSMWVRMHVRAILMPCHVVDIHVYIHVTCNL